MYDEYFPHQLRVIYQEHGGYIYTADGADLPVLENMPWVHLSEQPVRVTGCRFVPDLHEAILQAAADGLLLLHRYEDQSAQEHEIHRRCVARSLEGRGEDCYRAFIRRHMPDALSLEGTPTNEA